MQSQPDLLPDPVSPRTESKPEPAPSKTGPQRTGRYPLSPMQQGMLFNTLVAPRAGFEIEQLVIVLHEAINEAALRQAWKLVSARHDVLRTKFNWADVEQPLQEVEAAVDTPFEAEDWSMLQAADQENRWLRLLEEDRKRGFDLARAPLTRIQLICLGESHHKLLWTFHHILLDGRSFPILLDEWFSAHEAIRANAPPLSVASRPYREYIDFLGQRNVEADARYWKSLLKGFRATTPICGLKLQEGSMDEAFDPGLCSEQLSHGATKRLRALCQEHDLTLNTIVQGAWALWLSRSSGEEDVVFGATRACRHFGDAPEERVGLFINTLPVRVRVPRDVQLIPWLKELRSQNLKVRAHEHTPLVEVMGASEIQRGVPLFQSLLVYDHEVLQTTMNSRGEAWKRREIQLHEQPRFPLTVSATGEPQLLIEIFYNRNFFDGAVIERMLGHLRTILEAVAARPETRLADIPWLTRAELDQITRWNDTDTPLADTRCVHQLFEECAAKHPDRVAVVHPASGPGMMEDQRLTYAELNRQANRLARHLRRLGAGPETFVGVSLDRRGDMLVGILGILKTGAAYMPLDTFYPKERLAFMLQDSRIPILVTKNRLLHALPETDAKKVFIDADWSDIEKESDENPEPVATLENAAYLIYTSGSTGTPKGVVTTHGNLLNAYRGWEKVYDLKNISAHLQMASFSFDVFSGDMVRALCSGGKLVVCPHESLLIPKQLYALMRREQVEFAEFVPLVLRNLVQYLDETGQKLDFLRLLVAGSDSWYVKEYRDYRRFIDPNTRLINSYGITETTIDSTYFEGSLEGLASDGLVPIGQPFANTQMHILDADMRPLPIGVAGEIYIGGRGVTRGYLRRPDLTAEKFLPDPFRPSNRLYRTGDSARYLEDGNIEMLGRLDGQVKVRGFRIELGEIEGAIGKFDGVLEAVVSVQDIGAGEKRLIAYVVPTADSRFAVKRLRAYLKEKLPFYMVPAAFVTLDSLPMTPNGKVDRRALPLPEEGHFENPEAILEPRNETEARLVNVWKDVLGLQRIGVRDNFFELGGHSMLAVRLFARIKRDFNRELPLTALFQAATIEQLAKLLTDESGDWSCVVPLHSKGSKPPIFWLHTLGGGGGGGLFRYKKVSQYLPEDQPSYGIRAPAQPFSRINEMAAYYLSELRTIQPSGPYALAGYCFGGNVAYEMAQQLYIAGEDVAFLGLIESIPHFGAPEDQKWTPAVLWHYLRNLAVWSTDFAGQSPLKQCNRVIRKLAKIIKISADPHIDIADLDLGDFLENFDRPPEYRKFVETHWEALTHYNSIQYPGRVTVLRVRVQHPRNFDPSLWWDRLAKSGADVHIIPGTHETIFDEPHVRTLASVIQSCLDRGFGRT